MIRRIRSGLLLLLALVCFGGCGFTKDKPAAEAAIAKFHEIYNQGKLDDIWNSADPQFRTASTKQKYDEFLGAVQRKLGKATSTSNKGWNINTFNSRTTVSMVQQTAFEKGQGTESFVFSVSGTNALLLGYNIQSMDLITK
jgi:hypothetical protein